MLYNQRAFCNVPHRFMRAPLNIKAQGLKLIWKQTKKYRCCNLGPFLPKNKQTNKH